MESNKELLSRVIDQNTDLAKKQFEMSLDFSAYMNKQETRFVKIEGYLKSDSETNTEGAIEKLNRIEKWIQDLDTKSKLQSTKYGIAGAGIIIALKWIVTKIII